MPLLLRCAVKDVMNKGGLAFSLVPGIAPGRPLLRLRADGVACACGDQALNGGDGIGVPVKGAGVCCVFMGLLD